jgi:hypothetical protein
MRYPNLRYGDPAALAFYTQFYPPKDRVRMLARQLRRSERSVRNWLSGAEKMPWWVPEIIRLQRMEHVEMMRQMNMQPARAQLGIVSGDVLQFPTAPKNKNGEHRGSPLVPVQDLLSVSSAS